MVDSVAELKEVLNEPNYGLKCENYDNNQICFTATNYNLEFFKYLKEIKDKKKLCDITLRTSLNNNSTAQLAIEAHKIILCSGSAYFRALFTTIGFAENQDAKEIFIEDISFDILNQIVEFLYTAKITINELNVQSLLPAAKFLQIEDIVNACCMFLSFNMDSTNCIGIEEFASNYGCVDLTKYIIIKIIIIKIKIIIICYNFYY
jgi:hypothetical protein